MYVYEQQCACTVYIAVYTDYLTDYMHYSYVHNAYDYVQKLTVKKHAWIQP